MLLSVFPFHPHSNFLGEKIKHFIIMFPRGLVKHQPFLQQFTQPFIQQMFLSADQAWCWEMSRTKGQPRVFACEETHHHSREARGTSLASECSMELLWPASYTVSMWPSIGAWKNQNCLYSLSPNSKDWVLTGSKSPIQPLSPPLLLIHSGLSRSPAFSPAIDWPVNKTNGRALTAPAPVSFCLHSQKRTNHGIQFWPRKS